MEVPLTEQDSRAREGRPGPQSPPCPCDVSLEGVRDRRLGPRPAAPQGADTGVPGGAARGNILESVLCHWFLTICDKKSRAWDVEPRKALPRHPSGHDCGVWGPGQGRRTRGTALSHRPPRAALGTPSIVCVCNSGTAPGSRSGPTAGGDTHRPRPSRRRARCTHVTRTEGRLQARKQARTHASWRLHRPQHASGKALKGSPAE